MRSSRLFCINVSPCLLHALAAVVCASPLLLSAFLHPDPRGVETHVQLGLPPCALYRFTGLPCPFCGMTTAFALIAHGDVRRAIYVQPVGCLVYLLCVCGSAWFLLCAVQGRPWTDPRQRQWWRTAEKVALVVIGIGWIYKILAMDWLLS
jgi:hypothetical protein